MNFKTFIKQEARKVPVIKIIYWLVLPGKQQSNMCDLGQESLGLRRALRCGLGIV